MLNESWASPIREPRSRRIDAPSPVPLMLFCEYEMLPVRPVPVRPPE